MTIKKKRTVVSVLMALFATTTMAVTASANTGSFEFWLNAHKDDYSSPVMKSDSLQWALVDVTDGNFLSNGNDRLYLRVCENVQASDGVYYFATETKWVNSTYDNLKLNYTEATGVNGEFYRLRGYQAAEEDGLHVKGTFIP